MSLFLRRFSLPHLLRKNLDRSAVWQKGIGRFSTAIQSANELRTIPGRQQLKSPRFLSTNNKCPSASGVELSQGEFDSTAEDFLHDLTEWFERLEDGHDNVPNDFDINCSQGVLTVKTGSTGTFVINKQSPNRQIWLSSPFSGPKRFDLQGDEWIYRHSGETLAELISAEIGLIFLDPKLKFQWRRKKSS